MPGWRQPYLNHHPSGRLNLFDATVVLRFIPSMPASRPLKPFALRLFALLGMFLAAFSADAQMYKGVELVKADLLADTTAITPGKPFTVGLRLKMAPHWHTYWQYSGDAGLPTRITWQLPVGFQAGPLQWPVPEKIGSPGDIINYGYSDEVVLLTEITPPVQLPTGEVAIKGKSDWLVCESLCVPGGADLALSLPATGTPALANAEVFTRYRTRLPRPYDEKAAGFSLTRRVNGTDVVWTAATAAVAEFFPLPTGDADAGHPKVEHPSAGETRITVPVATGAADVDKIGGLLVQAGRDAPSVPFGWTVAPGANPVVAAPANAALPPPAVGGGVPSTKTAQVPAGLLFHFLLLGLLGGLILNVMPCVLPVISLKLFSLVKQSGDAPERILRHGLVYTAGVFAWFLGFAALVVGLKTAGHEVGYAVQLQNPWSILGLSAVTFVFALNLLGVFEIILPGGITNAAGAAAGSWEGYSGAFVQGVLVTVLGSSCTFPLFGEALGFAFSQSNAVVFAMFAAIATGMSAPFLLIAANPRWLRFLPRPGEWMERIKQGTGFLLLATVLWLLWNLGQMRGPDAVIWAGSLLLALGVACWVQGAFNTLVSSDRSRWLARAAILLLVLGGSVFAVDQIRAARLPATGNAGGAFAPQLAAALQTGRPVFVDFTANWCVNCKVNEKVVLDTAPVQKALQDRNALFLKADWTSGADDITRLLRQFKRAGVPLYVIYPAGKPDEPVIMPELLTQQIVLDAFTEADQRAKGSGSPVASR